MVRCFKKLNAKATVWWISSEKSCKKAKYTFMQAYSITTKNLQHQYLPCFIIKISLNAKKYMHGNTSS